MKVKIIILYISISCLFISCLPSNEYIKKYFFTNNEWFYNDAKTFTININDLKSKYHLFFLMQHNDAYMNSNIWIKLITKYPTGKMDTINQEIFLALQDGHWLGNKANGIVQHTINIAPNEGTFSFNEKGNYTFTMIQNMRTNPIKNIQNIGLQLKKIVD